jgi:HSP20 family protein
MNIKKFAPWNWFQHEGDNGQHVPVRRGSPAMPTSGYPLMQLHNEIDRLFEESFRGFPRLFFNNPDWPDMTSLVLKPNIDIKDTNDHYIVSVEIPGVTRDNVDISIDGNLMTISGEKKQETKEEKENYQCIERQYGSFERMLTLPQDADADNIEAKFRDGILTVNIKRKAQGASKESRKIEVKAA